MKKLVICLAIATVAVSCKKVPQGGNRGALKLEEGVERYSDDPQGGAHGHEAAAAEHKEETPAQPEAAAPKTDSTAAAKPAEAEKAPKAEH
ncbi:Uncharacterised protein [Chryseobacterium gleum]|jgi:hypothetical protein|uniref:Lipoprotein n=2 Tax=Chryseobacterium gleum TaxID=250 RepID=A0A3S4MN47_CHRGE|nr:hypothetical protein [Chryseobacterium gleum]EFK34467.1 hypothetical protein HMPREF0204_13536 [Chryseobacterium gleum ATCC 35910]MCE4064829.1 hypothetical protein [Chryseobacterium gleum]QBJ85562.1 hypothetical protein DDI74_04500 [Chryseobacterium gleum]QQY30317.1 hypothetical protein I6I60_15735 [Chryseobacterium gleum]VEE05362.1 Uncharacterised protein [Chryseobacterium gleum]